MKAEPRAGAVQLGVLYTGFLSGCGPGYRCDGNGMKAVCYHSGSPGCALMCLPCWQTLEGFMNATPLSLLVSLLWGHPGPADSGSPEVPGQHCSNQTCHLDA